MTKKLIIMGILMIPFLLLTRVATAQNYEVAPSYEQMPKPVQTQMDLNKSNGKSIYTNVIATFDVMVTGLDASEYVELKKRANDLSQINSITIGDNGKVTVVMDGSYPFVSIKSIFSILVSGITSINGIYTVKK